MCVPSKTLCLWGYLVFHREGLQHSRCHSGSFVMYISGAKFEEHCFNISEDILDSVFYCLRWLETVSRAYVWIGRYNHSLLLDATIMVSKHCPIIGEHVGITFVTL